MIYGVSTDSEYVHLAWRRSHPDLGALPFPMLADIKRELCAALGVLHPDEGVALRATFIVDPAGFIRFVSVDDLSGGRNPQEVLRVLDRGALKTSCRRHEAETGRAVCRMEPCRALSRTGPSARLVQSGVDLPAVAGPTDPVPDILHAQAAGDAGERVERGPPASAGRQQQADDIDRLAVDRLEGDGPVEPGKQAERPLQPGDRRMRDRHAVSDAGRAEGLAPAQRGADGLHIEAEPARRFSGQRLQKSRLRRHGQMRDDVLGANEVCGLHDCSSRQEAVRAGRRSAGGINRPREGDIRRRSRS